MQNAEVAVVGGGIIGLATAYAVVRQRPGTRVVVMEKEDGPAVHQSGRNSGVIHSGAYYRPGSLKAGTALRGRALLMDFCREHGVPFEITGKVIVAVAESERARLHALDRRAQANGVDATLIGRERLAELEPNAAGIAALHVPGAGIIDFAEVCRRLASVLLEAGGEFRGGFDVVDMAERSDAVVVTATRCELAARVVVNCAGLHSDLLARRSKVIGASQWRIVPFRGEYRQLAEHRAHLVRSMIYPVPDPRFPFLGPHFTRAVGGAVHAGPNAVLALAREGYSWRVVDVADSWDLVRFRGFRQLVARHWKTGAQEVHRSVSRRSFLNSLRRLVPDVAAGDLLPAKAGVRAQAVDDSGALIEDFVLKETARTVHVLNAPSPAATASLEIGRMVAARALERL